MNDIEIFQIPATITGAKMMSKWWRFQVDCEEVHGDLIHRMTLLSNKQGWFTFNVYQIEAKDIVNLPPLKSRPEERKSKAQRMRDILFRIWEKDNEGIDNFELYYDAKMEKWINSLKEKYLV